MANVCTICRHKCVAEINMAMIESRPLRSIADHWSVSKTALIRHKKEHLPSHLSQAAEARDFASASDLIERIKTLEFETKAILAEERTKSEEVKCPHCSEVVQVRSGSSETALRAIARMENQVRLAGEVIGALSAKMSVSVHIHTPADLWKFFEQAWAQLNEAQQQSEITRLLGQAEEDGWKQQKPLLIEGKS